MSAETLALTVRADAIPADGRRFRIEASAPERSALADELDIVEVVALSADLFHGPAHNNLGILHLHDGELYEAASEFEWARKLMPGHPDPRVNLALTLERAGRVDDAIDTYSSALEVMPGHVSAVQGLVRCQLRHDRVDAQTRERLEMIALSGESDEWRSWARMRLLALED